MLLLLYYKWEQNKVPKSYQGKPIFENFHLSQKEAYGRLELGNKPTFNARSSTISVLLYKFQSQNVSQKLIYFICLL